MPKKKDAAAADLAEKMLQVLEAQRRLGQDSYPLPLRRLAELTDPEAPQEVLKKAFAKKLFSDRTIVAQKKNLDAPVALRDDISQLACSPLLLEFVLQSLCSPQVPAWLVSKLKTKVDTKLKKPFEEAVNRQIQEGSLPATVGHVRIKNKSYLYLQRMAPPPPPPPPPPKKKPEVELAERMLRVLEAQRSLGGQSYPVRLTDLTGEPVNPSLLKKALATPGFKNRAAQLVKGHPNPPVALTDDVKQLAAHPLVLECALEASRTEAVQAFSVADLENKLIPDLKQPFGDAVLRQIHDQSLPPTVGWIGVKKNKLLFRIQDVHTSRQAGPLTTPPTAKPVPSPNKEPSPSDGPAHVAPPAHFETAFDEAFRRLDRHSGSHNFVNLVELRQALPMDRAAFDTGLRKLRIAGRYTLSAAEGRHGISPQEREAGIHEEGALLLFVSRRLP